MSIWQICKWKVSLTDLQITWVTCLKVWVFRQPDRFFLQKRVIKTGISRPSKRATRFSLPVFVFLTLLFLPACSVHCYRLVYPLSHLRSTKWLFLVISGCQYKDYASPPVSPAKRALVWQQKNLCYVTHRCCCCVFFALTMTESRRMSEEIARDKDRPNKDTMLGTSDWSLVITKPPQSCLRSSLCSHQGSAWHHWVKRQDSSARIPLSNLPDEATLLSHH